MQQQLAEIIQSLESAQSHLRRFTDTLPESDWNRKPAANKWSAAECVEHLNLTSQAYIPLLRDAVAGAGEVRRSPTKHYRHDALGWFLSKMFGPLRHLGKVKLVRVKTTPAFEPKPGHSRTQILSDFVRLQAELISLIRSADGLPIDGVKIVSPFGGRMKYNAYSALVIISRHQHRHIEQAEEAAR
ncbi:MAG: DinB-like domain protein [Gemmatimonadales bacterium]|nr:DinB-like domain protein [Gemmatimonadales bacterium]